MSPEIFELVAGCNLVARAGRDVVWFGYNVAEKKNSGPLVGAGFGSQGWLSRREGAPGPDRQGVPGDGAQADDVPMARDDHAPEVLVEPPSAVAQTPPESDDPMRGRHGRD